MFQVWIVDFGSQYTQLITRKCRELGFTSFIYTVQETQEKFVSGEKPKAVILSGGPQSVFEDKLDYAFLFEDQSLPILGICYGMHLLAQHFGGSVAPGKLGEYGKVEVSFQQTSWQDLPSKFSVWMSHSDHVETLPQNFSCFLKSHNGLLAGIQHESRPILGLQFHPEVKHSEKGKDILNFFLTHVAGLSQDWSSQEMLNFCLNDVEQVGKKKILCAFSGGVDSLVAASLVQQTMPDQLYCFFVDNGLLRPQDYQHIQLLKEKTELRIEIINAASLFLERLVGVDNPEEKRKIIGRTFIEVFEQKVHEFEEKFKISFEYLLQGTLYPDVIESISPHKKGGKSVTIKSHHNVGGLPERMKLKLLEPLRSLFKDEVRRLGEQLKLNREWVYRHPFPGPGLAVRILGEVTPEALTKVQASDQILFEELKNQHFYDETWQAFTVLLPIKTVGVKGD